MKNDKTSFGYSLLKVRDEEIRVVNHIPRFVPLENYTDSFGLQWRKFRKTQLDSHTGVPLSRDRIQNLINMPLDIFQGKLVLEAGCGAGRFTEILLNAGATVFCVDMSTAVEANYENFQGNEKHFVCQASILDLPTRGEQFDIVFCVGVVQHTPDPEETMRALYDQVKPGGLLIMDHYSHEYPTFFSRRLLRSFLLNRSADFSLNFCIMLTTLLWPLHRLLWWASHLPRIGRIFRGIRRRFLKLSPIVDYHNAYHALGSDLLREWAILDTHDTLTDTYKHLRSGEEISTHLRKLGFVDINAKPGGNGVEATARKPVSM